MKKRTLLLLLALLMLLTGCRRNEPVEEKPQPEQPPENPPVEEVVNQCLQIDELRIELTRGASSTGALAEAVKILPGLLETYFSDAEDLEIGQITVTVGASPAATAQIAARQPGCRASVKAKLPQQMPSAPRKSFLPNRSLSWFTRQILPF